MADHHEPEYFTKAREKGQIVVKGASFSSSFSAAGILLTRSLDPPKFDLDAYIANYRGIVSARTHVSGILLLSSHTQARHDMIGYS